MVSMSAESTPICATSEDLAVEAPPTEFSISKIVETTNNLTESLPTIEKLGKDELPGGENWDQTRAQWLKALDGDPSASVYLHPDLIFANFRDKATPIVLVRRLDNGDIASLAVL